MVEGGANFGGSRCTVYYRLKAVMEAKRLSVWITGRKLAIVNVACLSSIGHISQNCGLRVEM
jgi:hypothetical protein